MRIRKLEGLYVGGSSGANAVVSRKVAEVLAQESDRKRVVVTLFPDMGDKYDSKFNDPDWLNRLEA